MGAHNNVCAEYYDSSSVLWLRAYTLTWLYSDLVLMNLIFQFNAWHSKVCPINVNQSDSNYSAGK